MKTRQASVGLGIFAALTAGIIAPTLMPQSAEAIVGGVGVSPSVYPQYVRVLNNVTCGGTVIAADTVLTAAHCVDNGITAAQTSVLISDAFSRSVTNITVHPLWNGDLADAHDLAILNLTPGATAGVNPIQVGSPWNGSYYAANTPAAIVGHGATHGGGSATSELRAVDTVLRSDDYMDDIYNPWYWFDNWNASLMIGAGSLDHTVCNGDSGGPLVVDKDGTWNWIQVGVASFVQEWPTNCRKPGGFTELRNAQLAWIAQNVPAVMAKWGTCYTPSGFVGQSSARYVGWFLPGGQKDGNFYWEIACYGIPNPPPPPPPPGPGDPPPTEDPPPPDTTEPPDPPVCRLPPWKCPVD